MRLRGLPQTARRVTHAAKRRKARRLSRGTTDVLVLLRLDSPRVLPTAIGQCSADLRERDRDGRRPLRERPLPAGDEERRLPS